MLYCVVKESEWREMYLKHYVSEDILKKYPLSLEVRDFCFQFLSSHNLKIGVIVINLKLININNIFNVDNSNIVKVE